MHCRCNFYKFYLVMYSNSCIPVRELAVRFFLHFFLIFLLTFNNFTGLVWVISAISIGLISFSVAELWELYQDGRYFSLSVLGVALVSSKMVAVSRRLIYKDNMATLITMVTDKQGVNIKPWNQSPSLSPDDVAWAVGKCIGRSWVMPREGARSVWPWAYGFLFYSVRAVWINKVILNYYTMAVFSCFFGNMWWADVITRNGIWSS